MLTESGKFDMNKSEAKKANLCCLNTNHTEVGEENAERTAVVIKPNTIVY